MRRGGGQVYRYERLIGVAQETGGPMAERAASAEVTPDHGVVRHEGPRMADNLFVGLDTRLSELPALLGEEADSRVAAWLAEVQTAIDAVVRDFDFTAPHASVAGLARGLALLRAATGGAGVSPEMGFQLAVKERQFEDAIVAAAGVEVLAELGSEAGGAVVVPGEEVGVEVSVESAIPDRVAVAGVRVLPGGGPTATAAAAGRLHVQIPRDAPTAGPYFSRAGIHENHYQVSDSADLHLPWARPRFVATVDLTIAGVAISRTVPVTGSVPQLPYGTLARRAEVLPAVSVAVAPTVRVVPAGGGASRAIDVLVRVEANAPNVSVETAVELPAGWAARPTSLRHDFGSRGEVADASFSIEPPQGWSGEIVVDAVARATLDGRTREYRAGYQTIDHRDLPLARLRMPARTVVRSVAVAALDGLSVGYVMGVGDEVPAAIEALGATVRPLGEADLTGGALDDLDAIVVGTRAYAVRRDLVENNQRLFDYARGGGNLVVLYQTQEFVPSAMAPHPASLPRNAEEVSEEDAPVRLLAPAHPLLATPNRISEADFAGWLEQRGSKFFTDWDAAYTPLIETHDTGQIPQRGVWLAAEVGAGRYGYVALALHRQLPYGVPGAYRILSNLLARRPPAR